MTRSLRLRSRASEVETDLPLQVGLLVDASNSVRDRFKFEQESAIEFLNQMIRPNPIALSSSVLTLPQK